MFTSGFRLYSVGVVAENKKLSSDYALIVPTEVLPMLDGELKSSKQTMEDSGVDADGVEYTVSADLDNVIDAKWLNWSSNRQTSPDVRRGERVLLWQYYDTDRFYWTSLGLDHHLRKLETVRYAISATRDEKDTELTPDNTYSLEMSSHNKTLTLKTSKADGEPFAYTFQIDTEEGRFVFTDDVGNFIELESEAKRITIKNADQTERRQDKKEVYDYAKDYYEVHCDGPVHVISPEIHLGEKDALQPSVLGKNMWEAMERLIKAINESKVIGNLGTPTSPIQAVKPVEEPELITEGNVYSKVNKNQ